MPTPCAVGLRHPLDRQIVRLGSAGGPDDLARITVDEVRKLGLHERIKILAGVTPLKSAGMAKFMKSYTQCCGIEPTNILPSSM